MEKEKQIKLIAVLSFVILFLAVVQSQVAQTQVIDLAEKARDFFIEANKGNIIGQETLNKFGHNPVVGATMEDIQSEGGTLVFLQSPELITFVSNNVADTNGGAGANSLEVFGSDENFTEITEIINLSGTTPVNTTKEYLRVWRLKVNSVGVYGGTNIGGITGTAAISGTTQITIIATQGQSHTTHYTVPAGKEIIISTISFSIETGKTALVEFVVRENADDTTAPMSPTKLLKSWHGVQAPYTQNNKANYKFSEKTDIWFRSTSTAGPSIEVDLNYDIIQYAVGT